MARSVRRAARADLDRRSHALDQANTIRYGLTSSSDRWMAKMIIGTELNEGVSDKSSERSTLMHRVRSPLGNLPPTAATLSETMLPVGY